MAANPRVVKVSLKNSQSQENTYQALEITLSIETGKKMLRNLRKGRSIKAKTSIALTKLKSLRNPNQGQISTITLIGTITHIKLS